MSKNKIDVLLIDNFDSFTYNISHALQKLGRKVQIIRNNAITSEKCLSLNPSLIVIGPGPGRPENSGVSLELIDKAHGKVPILGICLGHQCIATYFKGNIIPSTFGPKHGKLTKIFHNNNSLFAGIPQGFTAVQYNSLVVDIDSLPSCLEISAVNSDGDIMGLCHKTLPIYGLQFHPESVMSEYEENLFLGPGLG